MIIGPVPSYPKSLLMSLFSSVNTQAAVVQPKLAPGVDPKSVVCEFWRVGQCQKVRLLSTASFVIE